MSTRLSVTAELNRPYVSATQFDDEPLYALLSLTPQSAGASTATQSTQRAPLNLIIVLDSSATMFNFQLSHEEREYWMSLALSRNEMERGEADDRDAVYWSGQTLQEMQHNVRKPMSMAIDAIKKLLQGLQHGDKVSVIAFADSTSTLFNDLQWSQNPEWCVGQLDALNEQRLPQEIGTGTHMAGSLKQARDLVRASASMLTINRIIVLSDGIVQDESDCLETITEIERDGFAITTLGVGDEFDEEFLMRVADNSRGAYYYAADVNQITDQLMQELTVIKSTALQQLYISAQGADGAIVQDVFMVRPYMTIFEEMDTQGAWVKARVGDLPSDMPTSLLVQIAPAPRGDGTYKVADVELTWRESDAAPGEEQPKLTTQIDVEFTDNPAMLARRNDDVQELVDRFSVYKYEREAQRAQERGDIETARQKLSYATRELHKLGEIALAQDLEAQIAALGSEEQDPTRVKRIKATTRRLAEKLLGTTRQLTPRE